MGTPTMAARAGRCYGRGVSGDHERVLAYHARSKHRPGRYAAALGYLDWDTQPNPFRVYEGAEALALPRRALAPGPSFEAVQRELVPPAPLDLESLSTLLLHSLALSAWKQTGSSRWSLRVNPSSGNLHPTEAYLLAPAIAGLSEAPGLHHYSPLLHALERRAALAPATWALLTRDLPQPCVLVGLSSIPWREAWKYGERAFRYCQHDLGHAVAALAFAAALLGWRARELPAPGDDALATLLGLRHGEGPEAELPETLLVLTPRDLSPGTSTLASWTPPPAALAALAALALRGVPNQLSEAHHDWPVIDEVARATRRPAAAPDAPGPARVHPPAPAAPPDPASPPAAALLRGRRSAVAMDGRTGLSRSGFYDMLLSTCPGGPALAALAGPARVDLALFVHRVDGVEPGLYLLLRDPARAELWRAAADPGCAWSRPPACPQGLDLWLLRAGDGRRLAAEIACGQSIASDGCFALAMLADMRELAGAPWLYRRLFWETGAIGQILYLEAEALGIAATGIGCFFDDRMHDLLGLQGDALQSLYHFTVGGRVEDERLRTLDPYFHLAAT